MIKILFKIKPELEGKASNVELIKVECPVCQEQVIEAWKFLLSGEFEQMPAAAICNSCNTNLISHQVSQQLADKRVGQLVSNWWYLDDKEEAGFKNYYPTDDYTQNAKDRVITYTQLFNQDYQMEKNLLLMGNTGTGKTHLSIAVARTLKDRGFKAGYLTSVQLFNKIRNSYGKGTTERIYQEMKLLDMLIIDDVGVETTKISDVSWTVSEWTKILDARSGLANIWTTNLDDENLPKIIGKRAFSRMKESTRIIDLFTNDYRNRKVVD